MLVAFDPPFLRRAAVDVHIIYKSVNFLCDAKIFEKIKFGKIKINIFKEYALANAKQAHEDLESRKLTGPAILIP